MNFFDLLKNIMDWFELILSFIIIFALYALGTRQKFEHYKGKGNFFIAIIIFTFIAFLIEYQFPGNFITAIWLSFLIIFLLGGFIKLISKD